MLLHAFTSYVCLVWCAQVGQIMSVVGVPLVVFTFVGYPYLAKKGRAHTHTHAHD
jgi:hypothetical protein